MTTPRTFEELSNSPNAPGGSGRRPGPRRERSIFQMYSAIGLVCRKLGDVARARMERIVSAPVSLRGTRMTRTLRR
jgi:hypothetical protein